MHEIRLWLKSGKEFKKGLILLSKYCRFESIYKSISGMRESRLALDTLETQLRKELKRLEQQEQAAPITAAPGVKPQIKTEQIEQLQMQANKHYQLMAVMQNRILATGSQEDRKKLYSDFLAEQYLWAEFVYKRDYLQQHGTPPPVAEKKITNAKNLPGSDYAKLVLLRSKVSRAKHEQIPLYKSKQGDKWKKKLEKRLNEIAEWEKQIAQLETATNG